MIETIDYLNRELNANIHRGVHYLSEEATTLYEASRERIRAFIGAAEKEEVIFTAGATASLNTVAYAWGEKFVRAGDNIVVSEMEHHSNIVRGRCCANAKGPKSGCCPSTTKGVCAPSCAVAARRAYARRRRDAGVEYARHTARTARDYRRGACRGGDRRRGRMSGCRARGRGHAGAGLRFLRIFGA